MDAKGIVTVIMCAAAGASAHGATYSDRDAFLADFPGLALQDFEAAGDLQRDYGDFVLSSGTGGGVNIFVTGTGFPSRVAVNGLADDTIDIDFTIPVEAVGFQVAGIDFFQNTLPRGVRVQALDAGNSVLADETFQTAGRTMNTFIGFGGLGEIATIRISDLPMEAAWLAIDDVRYGIPSPGVLTPLLLGVLPRRRRP